MHSRSAGIYISSAFMHFRFWSRFTAQRDGYGFICSCSVFVGQVMPIAEDGIAGTCRAGLTERYTVLRTGNGHGLPIADRMERHGAYTLK